VVIEMSQNNDRRFCRVMDLIDERSQKRSFILKALEYIPFVFHARMTPDTLNNHGSVLLASGAVSVIFWNVWS
jgi:hypothetical protein